MKKSITVLVAAGAASAASAQSLDIEGGGVTVAPGEAVTLAVFADSGPADYAVAGWNASVVASGTGEGRWSNNMLHIGPTQAHTGWMSAGTIEGHSVTGIRLGQGAPALGFTPVPGRVIFWSAEFVSDGGSFEIRTETTRFEVYTEPGAEPPTRRTLIPTEGVAHIHVIPSPATLTLLALGGLAAARRRR